MIYSDQAFLGHTQARLVVCFTRAEPCGMLSYRNRLCQASGRCWHPRPPELPRLPGPAIAWPAILGAASPQLQPLLDQQDSQATPQQTQPWMPLSAHANFVALKVIYAQHFSQSCLCITRTRQKTCYHYIWQELQKQANKRVIRST